MSAPVLGEISGIAASRTRDQMLWMVNDGGNAPMLYSVTLDGNLRDEYLIENIENTDWEDLSGVRHQGRDYLVIADVGDNKAQRKTCSLFFVEEPSLGPPSGSGQANSLQYRWQIKFRYEDGPRDCEAVAVDAKNKKILLLSKRERYPVLYELPLALPPNDEPYTAISVAQLTTLPQPTALDLEEKYGKYRSRPTAMDISSDGSTLVILTYKHAYRYERTSGQTWQDAFLSQPELIRLPLNKTGELVQREALCIDHRSGQLIVTTEQLPAPIYTLAPAKE